MVQPKKTTYNITFIALPDNVEIITMPRLSDTMEEGTVANWLKSWYTINEGDRREK